ncbi:MAG: N-acetyltransferase family protein [Aquabacterium sp.]
MTDAPDTIPPDLKIRAATAADYDAWLPLWLGYQKFYNVDLPLSTTRITWARLLDPAEPMHCALADWGGRIAGMVHFIQHRTCWYPTDTFYLQDLFTDEALRGRGLGRRLIQHVYDEAKARGIARVYWLTHESNTQAMVLYDQVADKPGFVQYRKQIG